MTKLEQRIRELTRPLNGQYPRPWMSHSAEPGSSRVFLIGNNPATPLAERIVGDHNAFIDALYNRNSRSIAKVYEEARGEKGPSLTRQNINRVTALMKAKGIADVLETNVVCYGTPMGSDLAHFEHKGGRLRGANIFEVLLDEIRSPVLLAHGTKTRQDLVRLLQCALPELPSTRNDGIRSRLIKTGHGYQANVFLIPSLAPPAWNQWAGWAWPYIDMVCQSIHEALRPP